MKKSLEVAILTKSSKYKNYCVAGIDMQTGQWVRLVSPDDQFHGAVTPEDIRYAHKKVCEVLDIACVAICGKLEDELQPENVLIDRNYLWKWVRKATLEEVLDLRPTETSVRILGNSFHSVSEENVKKVGKSLTWVEVQNLILYKTTNQEGLPKVKASFRYRERMYLDMAVTDPKYYYITGRITTPRAILVVSLPNAAWNGRYYKFIAQIFPLPT